MNAGNRLKEFLKHINLSQGKFEAYVKLSNGYVNKVGDNLTIKSLNKISKTYPELNTTWLLTGEGEMLKGKKTQQADESIDKDDFLSLLKKKDEQMDRLLALMESQQKSIENLSQRGGAGDVNNAARKAAQK
jgi:transcriptional regulator with XRE-family HTH domain